MRKPSLSLQCPLFGQRVHLPMTLVAKGSARLHKGQTQQHYHNAYVGRCPQCVRCLVVEVVAVGYSSDTGIRIGDITDRPCIAPILEYRHEHHEGDADQANGSR